MAAEQPTILATSGGLRRGERAMLAFGPLLHYAIELARPAGKPRLCYIGTASGDDPWWSAQIHEAATEAKVELTVLNLFPMPPTSDLAGMLGEHDAVWVGGGSCANLLALWRLHGLDAALWRAWQAGVVMAGVSAGSLCWHVGGTTDSFRPELDVLANGLGFLPYANGVHYDSEVRRRPLLQSLVAAGTLPEAYATDDGVGLHYVGDRLVEAVSEIPDKGAYHVVRDGDAVTEERIEARLLDS